MISELKKSKKTVAETTEGTSPSVGDKTAEIENKVIDNKISQLKNTSSEQYNALTKLTRVQNLEDTISDKQSQIAAAQTKFDDLMKTKSPDVPT
jgi:uncharacterized membrane protein YjjP (DUF1212 family)